MDNAQRTVLITGCSTGIGRALALECHKRGLHVFATARNVDSLTDLAAMGMTPLKLDVNDPSDVAAAAERVNLETGGLDMLVNNAGFIAMGPLVEIPLPRLRLQFETNVVSVVSMIQAFAPAMMKNKKGCIVNIGSVSGILPSPFAGAYCASKTAVHSLSDALRVELSPFNVRVVTVQPGGITSELGNTAHKGISRPDDTPSFYSAVASAIEERALASQKNATPVADFAEQLMAELLKENPSPVIRLGKQSFLLPFIRYALPTRFRDSILTRKFKLNTMA